MSVYPTSKTYIVQMHIYFFKDTSFTYLKGNDHFPEVRMENSPFFLG
jgi:hypothetical protein